VWCVATVQLKYMNSYKVILFIDKYVMIEINFD